MKKWKILHAGPRVWRVYIDFPDGSTIFDRQYKTIRGAIKRAVWLNKNTYL